VGFLARLLKMKKGEPLPVEPSVNVKLTGMEANPDGGEIVFKVEIRLKDFGFFD
jgi:hypothetical protein